MTLQSRQRAPALAPLATEGGGPPRPAGPEVCSGSPRCPWCGRTTVRRVSRRSLLDRLCSLMALYPFRCQVCRFRFRAWAGGRRWQRVKAGYGLK
jgi:hypothetical protein